MGTNYNLTILSPRIGHGVPMETVEGTLHVGKHSIGWAFSFRGYIHPQHVFESEIRTVADWRRAMAIAEAMGGYLQDEYGTFVSMVDFWGLVESSKGGRTRATDPPPVAYRHLFEPSWEWEDEGCDFYAGSFC